MLRATCTSESFWLDELHSHWCIRGTWSELTTRAAAGNQTPLYFALLRVWQLAPWPTIELAGRSLSIVAGIVTVPLLIVTASRVGHQAGLWGGLIAGLLFSLDQHAIFFGTETRAYALLMLACAVQAEIASCWLTFPTIRKALTLSATQTIAVAIHPTAIIPAVALNLALVISSRQTVAGQAPPQRWALSFFLLTILPASECLLLTTTFTPVWERRSQWIGVGGAFTLANTWHLFSWLPLLLVPAAGAVLAKVLSRRLPNLVGKAET